MHVARKCDVDLVLETAAVDFGHVGRGRPDTQRRAPFRFLAVRFCNKRDLAGAEFVVRAELEDRSLFPAFGDRQSLGRSTDDRQLLVCLRAQLDLGVLSRAFDVIGDGHAGFEFIARRGQHRHARRDYERSANQCLTLARSDGVIRNRDRHDFQGAVEIIRHIVNDFALYVISVNNARPKHHRLVSNPFEWI